MCRKNSLPYSKLDLNNKKILALKNKIIPPELFKYTKVRYAKDLLYDEIIYLPELSELNDPFEGTLLCDEEKIEKFYEENKIDKFMDYILEELNDETIDVNQFEKIGKLLLRLQSHEEIDNIRNAIIDGIYVICLSGRKDINSLWAHYADNHKGICIEYDLINTKTELFKNLCFPIEYIGEFDSTYDVKSLFETNSMDLNIKLKPLLIKAGDWGYEEEWRIIFDDSIISDYNVDFEPYEPYVKFLRPQAVYMGIAISNKDEKTIKNICKLKKIPLFKAVKSKEKYKFDFKEVILDVDEEE